LLNIQKFFAAVVLQAMVLVVSQSMVACLKVKIPHRFIITVTSFFCCNWCWVASYSAVIIL